MSEPVKGQTREEAIARVVAEYEQSGLTRRDFSEQTGIAVSTLDYWRRQVRDRNLARIVPVEVEPGWRTHRDSGFQLGLPNGVRIASGWDFPEEGLARLLRVVAEQ